MTLITKRLAGCRSAAPPWTEVKADYRRLLVEREDDWLRPLDLTPTVAEYVTDPEKPEKKEAKNPEPGAVVQPPEAKPEPVPAAIKQAKRKMNYFRQLAASGKRASSIQKERGYLNYWAEKLGPLRRRMGNHKSRKQKAEIDINRFPRPQGIFRFSPKAVEELEDYRTPLSSV